MKINDKINKLRSYMKEAKLEAYIIPSADPHLSEDLAGHWKSREYFSGFDGSAGTLVVTLEESGLWTDGRYFIQAESQLEGSEIKLYKMFQPKVPTITEFLIEALGEKQTVGIDGKLFSAAMIKKMMADLAKHEIDMNCSIDLVSTVWKNRVDMPATDVFIHEVAYTGLTCAQKLDLVREKLTEQKADGYIMNLLGSIAWLFNVRAQDIDFNPMVISYGVVLKESAYLFVNQERVGKSVSDYLNENGVTIVDYHEIDEFIKHVAGSHFICDNRTLNYELYHLLEEREGVKITDACDLVEELKAIKNEAEIKNIENAQIKDGCALVHAMMHVESSLANHETMTEYQVSEMLEKCRRQQPLSYGSSFNAIVGYGANAAMMHYHPTKEVSSVIENKGFLLIDSGGQYLDGTTDLTRTFVMGEISEEEKYHFTLVLKAHIGLSLAIFQKGCTGGNLDILSRRHLWDKGLDYRCGTGHGVAYFGAVHEGPQGFGLKSNIELKPGMMLTNEPGIYEEGKHGIRIENTLLVVEKEETDYGKFYQFEVVSYFPIDTLAIDVSLLTDEEKNWLNDYHQLVFEKLSPTLDKAATAWLAEKVKPV